MKALPEKYRIAKSLKTELDTLLLNSKEVEISAKSLFEYVSKKNPFKEYFDGSIHFSRYLRSMHSEDELRQFVPNYEVDTSIHHHWKWKFFKLTKQNINSIQATYQLSNNKYINWKKVYTAKNGEKLRSEQELFIYNKLLGCKEFEIAYEAPLNQKGEEQIYPDFRILNKHSNKTYYWEHFGMTDNEEYKEGMTERIARYKAKGRVLLEEGGNVICTYYSDNNSLQNQVIKFINKIRSNHGE